MKKCNKCGEIKLETEFYEDKRNKNGFRGDCKKCHTKQKRKYYKNNIEKCKKRHRKWIKNNPKYKKEYQKKYYENNSEKFITSSKEWRENNPKRYKKNQRKYYLDNSEKFKKESKKWRKDNLEKAKKTAREYRKNNIEKIRERNKQWMKNNPIKHKKNQRKYKRKMSKIPSYRINRSISIGIWTSLKGNKNGMHWETTVGYTLEELIAHLEAQFEDWMNWDNYGEWHIDHIKPVSLFNFTSVDDKEFKECWALENLQPLEAMENIIKSNNYTKI